MKRRNEGLGPLSARQRIFFAIAGPVLLLPGLMALLRGGSGYIDYRGLVAFAPAMVLVAIIMIAIAVVKRRPARMK